MFARLRDHRGNGLADVAHALARQRPTRRFRHSAAIARADRPERAHRADLIGGHVTAGENGDDARRSAGPRSVNVADDGVRVRGTDDHAVQFAGKADVSNETSSSAQQPEILDAPDRRADTFRRGLCRGVYCNSSRRISSRS
jgi:hypothetical protein